MVVGIPKDVVDHTLESHGCIAESERHDSIFEEAVSATKCCFPLVSLLDSDVVLAVLEVDCIEVFRVSNSFLELIQVGEGVTVGDSNRVDCSVVNAQS